MYEGNTRNSSSMGRVISDKGAKRGERYIQKKVRIRVLDRHKIRGIINLCTNGLVMYQSKQSSVNMMSAAVRHEVGTEERKIKGN